MDDFKLVLNKPSTRSVTPPSLDIEGKGAAFAAFGSDTGLAAL